MAFYSYAPYLVLVVFATTIVIVLTIIYGKPESIRQFPENFKFGVATSAYQIEGAWNEDGKGENIWDHMCHTNPSFVVNSDNGDVACDSYHQYEKDVELLVNLGVDFYRFSLSWSRILPTGRADQINTVGVQYYKNLISLLLQKGIEPVVTIFHWDLPQPLQEIGGWPNPELADIFADYARVVFKLLGDNVKTWITINEPMQMCSQAYGDGTFAPAINRSGLEDYACGHTLLKAHAKAWHVYDTEFRPVQKGRITLALDSAWYEPANASNPEDLVAAEKAIQFRYGWFANPVYLRDYPEVMKEAVSRRSSLEGYISSRLPAFTEEELDYISGTFDFMALNTYSTQLCKPLDEAPPGNVSYYHDRSVLTFQNENWVASQAPWIKVTPWGLRKLLNWLKNTYNNPEIIITENGYSDNGALEDTVRVEYYRSFLENALLAILDDNVNLTAYTAWSLMDNFEWSLGYDQHFGLHSVNFSDPERKRTPKASAYYYSNIVKTRKVPGPTTAV